MDGKLDYSLSPCQPTCKNYNTIEQTGKRTIAKQGRSIIFLMACFNIYVAFLLRVQMWNENGFITLCCMQDESN